MAMNFFEHQEAARKRTALLVALFSMATISIVVATCAAVALALAFLGASDAPPEASISDRLASIDWRVIAGVGAAVLLIVGGASLVKLHELRAGGSAVAERLGGLLLTHDAANPDQRRALNVVEEMAIASGVPVPPVYIMDDEHAVNAFAAGYAPHSAVIGLTRGAVERLTRDELQGVVAHEFSHILNGDMRLNIRLIGLLHGILAIGVVGSVIMRSVFYGSMATRRRRSSKEGGGGVLIILALGLTLIVIGSLGVFFGNLIKAAASRQREYLADASAVQFTRNPTGLAGALRRIGGMSRRARLRSPNAQIASHMYFADGLGKHFTSLLATHPPLPRRIKRIDPAWDGSFPETESVLTTPQAPEAASGVAPLAQSQTSSLRDLQDAVHHIGAPTPEHAHAAADLLRAAPPPLLRAAHDAFGAQALIFSVLLDDDHDTRRQQLALLEEQAPRGMAREANQLLDHAASLDPALRLPLLEVALGSARPLPLEQRRRLHALCERLFAADRRLSLLEWCVRRMLLRRLSPKEVKTVTHYGMQRLAKPLGVVLSTLAAVGSRDADRAQAAFAKAAGTLGELRLAHTAPEACSLKALDDALNQLAGLAPKQKRRLLEACAMCVAADAVVKPGEAETLRAIADALDCPMPPILATRRNDAPTAS